MNKDQLLSLTLRQLRQEASKLSVPLYSRKTKAVLVDLILKYQEKSPKQIKSTSEILNTFARSIGKNVKDLQINDLVLLIKQR